MSRAKLVVLGFFAWATLGGLARADVISNGTQWTFWNASSGAVSNLGSPSNSSPQPPAAPPSTPSPSQDSSSSPPAPSSPPSSAPMSYSAPAPSASAGTSSGTTYDAFVNMGSGPFPSASTLTTGGAQAWYNSPQVASLFGGQPTAQQQTNFENTVLQRVEQTFQLSGVPVNLTDNPNASAAHTLSLVSNTSGSVGSVIGLTNVGGSGFSFVNQEAQSAQSVDQLEWIVAHNISHELMLAFGVPEKYDTTGNYIDARDANFSMMVNPNATFSQAAAQALVAQSFTSTPPSASPGEQFVEAQTIPEPATIAVWCVGALAAAAQVRSRRVRRRTAA